MIYIARIFCFLRGIARTIYRGTWLDGYTVSGHDFREIESVGQPQCVQVLACELCEETSVAWRAE